MYHLIYNSSKQLQHLVYNSSKQLHSFYSFVYFIISLDLYFNVICNVMASPSDALERLLLCSTSPASGFSLFTGGSWAAGAGADAGFATALAFSVPFSVLDLSAGPISSLRLWDWATSCWQWRVFELCWLSVSFSMGPKHHQIQEKNLKKFRKVQESSGFFGSFFRCVFIEKTRFL